MFTPVIFSSTEVWLLYIWYRLTYFKCVTVSQDVRRDLNEYYTIDINKTKTTKTSPKLLLTGMILYGNLMFTSPMFCKNAHFQHHP